MELMVLFEDIEEFLSDEETFYAHTKGEEKETLKEHTNRCEAYFQKLWEEKREKQIVLRLKEDIFQGKLSQEGELLLRKMIYALPTFHDMGKLNPVFQKEKMGHIISKEMEGFVELGSRHSMLSAVLYFDFFLQKIQQLTEKKEKQILKLFLFLHAYIISRHHSNLNEWQQILKSDDEGEFYRVIRVMEKNKSGFYKKQLLLYVDEENNMVRAKGYNNYIARNGGLDKVKESLSARAETELFAYVRLMYSILVAADYFATSEFMTGCCTEDFEELEDIDLFYQAFEEGEKQQKTRKYEKKYYGKQDDFTSCEDINVLRKELFLDTQNVLLLQRNKNIFYLEAPTGSGKSNAAFHLSFLLAKEHQLNRIFYVYPFNALVEQNMEMLSEIFQKKEELLQKITIINSLAPISCKGEKAKNRTKEQDRDNTLLYEKALLDRQFLNYPVVLTTNVSLFQLLFDNRQTSVIGFHQLMNSVIVLDEIQSYRNEIWTEIIQFLHGFARLLNIKVIIMSATLPNLNELLDTPQDYVRLVEDRDKYFKNPKFAERVRMNFELLEDFSLEILYRHILSQVKQNSKILVEFIFKKSAEEFYEFVQNEMKSEEWAEVRIMTGEDNPITRKKIIAWAKEANGNKPKLLIATQVVEAGVDIDMSLGYKDISLLDSEEQFAGRVNRSSKRESEDVYFFNYNNAKRIYQNDLRKDKPLTLESNEMREILVSKEFGNYYAKVLSMLKEKNRAYTEENVEMFFQREVGNLNMPGVARRMSLIEDKRQHVSLFFSRVICDEGKTYDGDEIWQEYREVLEDNTIKYAKKQVMLSRIRSKVNYFIYQVDVKEEINLPEEQIGEFYFIEKEAGAPYFVNDRFDREKFLTDQRWI